MLRVLKPGACFAGYEWCATDKYDRDSADHRTVMAEIELGNGLPDVRTCAETVESLKKAGFEVIDARDLALTVRGRCFFVCVGLDVWRRCAFQRGRGTGREAGREGVTPYDR